MLDSIIRDVCKDMAPDLTDDQMRKLESVLYIHLHDMRIEEECTAIEPADQDNDAKTVREFLASKKISGRADSTLAQYSNEMLQKTFVLLLFT